jgi:threonine synthase
MQYYSTKSPAHKVSLKEAVLRALPSDNGLYMPETIPQLSDRFIGGLSGCSLLDIAREVATAFLEGDLPQQEIDRIVEEVISFEAPLVEIGENLHVLELFHGPTLAFKDFGARFMARLMSYLIRGDNRELTILVATSGDTGSAVAQGFLGIPGIRVVIFYPSGQVSEIQEKQLTTMGQNISAIEIKGSFDECQALVKEAFLDAELNKHLRLTSANSINIARLIPQSFYYFSAYSQLANPNLPLVFSVPSGNFGNLTGLPVSRFIAATNANDVFPRFLNSGLFEPRPSECTLSNAMDVGNPSNLVRIQDLYGGEMDKMRKAIWSASFDDKATLDAIARLYRKVSYTFDPHGAVGYLGWRAYSQKMREPFSGVILETAHPAKFLETVERATRRRLEMPDRLAQVLDHQKEALLLAADFSEVKEYLLGKVKS